MLSRNTGLSSQNLRGFPIKNGGFTAPVSITEQGISTSYVALKF